MSDESIVQAPIAVSATGAADAPWRDYQEEAAEFFRSLGLDASTNVSVDGVRTTHDVDVLVRSHHAGFDVLWLVECKLWKTPVSKLHVLALREIVAIPVQIEESCCLSLDFKAAHWRLQT